MTDDDLRPSQAPHNHIGSGSAVAWEFDVAGDGFAYFSAGIETLLGYPVETCLERGFWFAHMHPDSADDAASLWRARIQESVRDDIEYRMIGADGSVVYLRDYVTDHDGRGPNQKLRGVLIDVTRERKSQEDLERTREVVKAFSPRPPMAAASMDSAGRLTFINTAMAELFGKAPEELEGRSFTEVLPPDIRDELARVDAAREDVGAGEREYVVPITTESGRRLLRFLVATLFDSDGEVCGASVIAREISESEAAREHTRNQAEQFDAVFALSGDLYFRVDAENSVVEYKAATDTSLLVEPRLFESAPISRLVPADFGSVIIDSLAEARRTGGVTYCEYESGLGADHRTWEAQLLPMENGDAAVVVRDVSERAIREADLRGSRDFLAKLLALLDAAVIVVDGERLVILQANEPAERMFGSALKDMRLDALQPSQPHSPHFDGEAFLALGPGESRVEEMLLQRYDGVTFEAEVFVRAMGGDTQDRLVTIRDISARKEAQRLLRESEERFRNVVESAPFGLHFFKLRADGELVLVGANPAADRILHVNHESLFNQPIETAFPTLDDSGRDATYRRIAREGGSWQSDEMTYVDGDLSIAYEVTAFHTATNQMASAFYDVTDRAEAATKERAYRMRLIALAAELTLTEERERRHLAEELHDRVSQPLAVANMRLSAAIDASDPTSHEELTLASVLLQEAIRETRTVTTELYPPVLHELGLAAAIRWLGDDFARTYGLVCDIEISSEPLDLDDDVETLVFRAAREFLVNVVKHAETLDAHLTLGSDGNDVELVVADEGRGFEPDPDSHSGGLQGFGLFSLRERLQHLGGSLEVSSVVGQGTTLSMRLPRHFPKM